MQEVGRLLAQLHKQRLSADYRLDDGKSPDSNTCALLIKSASIGVDVLDASRLKPDVCDLIRSGVREYDRKING